MDLVHMHGPGPWGGPWTPVHVLYTSKKMNAKKMQMTVAYKSFEI